MTETKRIKFSTQQAVAILRKAGYSFAKMVRRQQLPGLEVRKVNPRCVMVSTDSCETDDHGRIVTAINDLFVGLGFQTKYPMGFAGAGVVLIAR